MLEVFGFDVLTAYSGQEAIEIFRRHTDKIILMLLDMTMPQMSGEDVFREIIHIKNDARIIISSGYNEYDIKTHFADTNLSGFIKKPYELITLKEKIYEVLNNQDVQQDKYILSNCNPVSSSCD